VAVPEREVDRQAADELEAGGGAIGPLLHQAEQLDCSLRRRDADEAVSTVFGAGTA